MYTDKMRVPVRQRHRHNLKQRFEVLKTLGQGTYGKVKLAIERATGVKYAIKSIRKKRVGNDHDLNRIRREIEIMASLSHPHIIQVYEVFENAEKIVLVLEYASGGELYDYCNDKQGLYDEEARKFFRQILSAVHYLHKNGIVHRDLKLENIVMDSFGNVKIADFGLANIYGDKLLKTFCGSPLYASPEIVNGLPYNGPEVDCWSLGVLLYATVYGCMPFDGSDFRKLRNQITAGKYYQPDSNHTEATSVIRRLLTPNAAKRATVRDICKHWWVNRGYEHKPYDSQVGQPVNVPCLQRRLKGEAYPPESDSTDNHHDHPGVAYAMATAGDHGTRHSHHHSGVSPPLKGILKKPKANGLQYPACDSEDALRCGYPPGGQRGSAAHTDDVSTSWGSEHSMPKPQHGILKNKQRAAAKDDGVHAAAVAKGSESSHCPAEFSPEHSSNKSSSHPENYTEEPLYHTQQCDSDPDGFPAEDEHRPPLEEDLETATNEEQEEAQEEGAKDSCCLRNSSQGSTEKDGHGEEGESLKCGAEYLDCAKLDDDELEYEEDEEEEEEEEVEEEEEQEQEVKEEEEQEQEKDMENSGEWKDVDEEADGRIQEACSEQDPSDDDDDDYDISDIEDALVDPDSADRRLETAEETAAEANMNGPSPVVEAPTSDSGLSLGSALPSDSGVSLLDDKPWCKDGTVTDLECDSGFHSDQSSVFNSTGGQGPLLDAKARSNMEFRTRKTSTPAAREIRGILKKKSRYCTNSDPGYSPSAEILQGSSSSDVLDFSYDSTEGDAFLADHFTLPMSFNFSEEPLPFTNDGRATTSSSLDPDAAETAVNEPPTTKVPPYLIDDETFLTDLHDLGGTSNRSSQLHRENVEDVIRKMDLLGSEDCDVLSPCNDIEDGTDSFDLEEAKAVCRQVLGMCSPLT